MDDIDELELVMEEAKTKYLSAEKEYNTAIAAYYLARYPKSKNVIGAIVNAHKLSW